MTAVAMTAIVINYNNDSSYHLLNTVCAKNRAEFFHPLFHVLQK